MSARAVDWALALLVGALVATGVLMLFAGAPHNAWVYDAHDALGLAIAVMLAVKLHRVWPRVSNPARRDSRTPVAVTATGIAVAGLGSGILWAAGVTPSPAGYSLLSWHDALGAILVVLVVAHIILRAKPLRVRDLAQRRQVLALGGVALGSLIAWRTQRPLERLFELRGAGRRFTGSYEADSFAGNAFPSTSWVADNPAPTDPDAYRLTLAGLVGAERHVTLAQLDANDELTATLDCTGGFYSTQRWQGIQLGRLIDLGSAAPTASHVSLVSKTGYRWGFALADARGLLLATRVGGEPLSHEHGAPVRLVVPGGRGYQWVKWVERVELLDHPDYGAPASTVWSSFS